MNTKRHFTAEFKAQIVRQILAEEQTINQLAAEHGIHPNQLYRWREIALVGLPSLFASQAAPDQAALQAAHDQQVHDLYAQIGKLTTQLAWLEKKLAGELSRADRLALVDRADPDLSLKDQAALLGLSRSSLYYQPAPPSPEEVALKHRIDEIYTATPFYGARRIAAQLTREGQAVNRKTVARYMADMRLTAIYPGPHLSKRAAQAAIYPYLLRNLPIVRVNHVWGIEIVCTQLIKPDLFSPRGGRDRVPDLDLLVGDHHTVNQQFH
jgi:putative transposase